MLTEACVLAYIRHLENDRALASSTREGYRQELMLLVHRQVDLEPDALAVHIGHDGMGRSLAPRTRNRRLIILREFFAYLIKDGILIEDPTRKIERARVPRSRKTPPTAEDLAQVLRALYTQPPSWDRIRDGAILHLFFYTGLRVSELQRLNLDQVDLNHGLLRQALRKGGHQLDMDLNPCAVLALLAWLKVRPMSEGEPGLFVNRYGARLSVRMIQRRLAEMGEAAGLTLRLHPHIVRRGHATELMGSAGASLESVRQSLDHASLVTTAGYIDGDRRLLRVYLNRMPELPAIPLLAGEATILPRNMIGPPEPCPAGSHSL